MSVLPTAVRRDAIVDLWQCQKRGLCCRDWSITTSRPEWARIRRALQGAGDPRAALFGEDRVRLSPGGYRIVPSDEDHRCVFLTGENLCGLRMAHGTRPLPAACSKFPFLALMTPQRFLVGLSFACPTALGLVAAHGPAVVDADPGELPTETFVNACAGDFGDLDAERFWEAHQGWVQRYRALSGTAGGRILALMRESTGIVAPPLPEGTALFDGCEGDGAEERLLDGLRAVSTGRDPDLRDLPPCPPEAALLVRYLEHRLAVPTWLGPRYTAERLWTGLLALRVRYEIERRRGASPLLSLWRVDKLACHGPLLRGLLGEGDDPETLWGTARLVASLQPGSPESPR